jgi:serine protease Do
VIEINGDEVKVNGKDVDDLENEEVTVRRNKLRDVRALARTHIADGQNWNFNFDDDHISLFSEDANRAMLGVVTEAESDDKIKGAKINSVSKESAAEKAGLQKGDIITKIGDETVEDPNDVSEAIKSHKPGDKVDVTVLRNGKEQKIKAELGKWKGVNIGPITAPRVLMAPEAWAPDAPDAPPVGGIYFRGGGPRLGLSIQDTEDGKGVKILNVAEESNAAKAGLKKDDIITHINDEEVNSADEVSEMVRDNKGEPSMKIKVLRNGKSQDIEVRTPRKLKTTNL